MLEPGTVLQGRYTVDQMLGQGGRGTVYLARQDMLGGRRVAIKETHFDFVLPEEHAEAVAQFHREARLLASLEHKNLVDVKDFFEENGNLYLVMDFVEGETLEEILERSNGSPANLDEVFVWADQICDVLDCLHRHKPPIIFRDLKPGNIMLDHKGDVRLIDFGIARVLEPDSRDLTERAGTVGYAPYEQHAGKTPDARTDIYALGATLYDLMTGHPPPSAVAIRTGEETLDVPRELNPNLPQILEVVILKMMASKPEDRFPNIGEVRKALRLAQKTAQTGQVKRVSLDSEEPIRKLPPLDAKGTTEGRKRFLTPSKPPPTFNTPTNTSTPKKPELQKPPVVVHHASDSSEDDDGDDFSYTPSTPASPRPASATPAPAPGRPAPAPAPVPAAPLPAPATDDARPRSSLFNIFRRDPGFGSAWIQLENGKLNVVLRTYRNGIVSFACTATLGVNETVPLVISVKNVKDGQYTLSCTLLKESVVDNLLEYLARIQQVPPIVDKILEATFPAPALDSAPGGNPRDGRRAPRIQTAFQVMSRQLPGYKALSTNISMTGIQLDVREEVTVGTQLQMKLDFDDFRFQEVNCLGEVKWCRPGEERDWLIGIAFVTLSDEARETVKRYIQLVAGAKPMRM